ncbi:unnamed protein product [Didymodactylos carnosus]|uniref:Uncharacterized protein n=1 Tax=Didymodactylos carnosus TaxID=1234261 RepID=A0A814X0F4_9BILA|nr:unnamed protein product [Didymodactylos carnosus]CAF1447176.1 unnamed protein product [Didymodactylos carnosus]CAF3975401.1 unnamed protein product [Didymodactylos carnosus]CAF4242411.1 unnamed protein product [Didymodactylos carnosus]
MIKTAVKPNIKGHQEVVKQKYDRYRSDPQHSIGDKVLVRNRKPQNKFSPKFLGPYTMVQHQGKKAYLVRADPNSKTYQVAVSDLRAIG